MVGDFPQKPPTTPTKPTLAGGRLNKAVMVTVVYLHSHYCGQKCSSETRMQAFPGQEHGIGRSRRRCNCRRAIGSAVLPGRGPTHPLGRRRYKNCGLAATRSSGQGQGSVWATRLCWHEAIALVGTRPMALSEGVCHAIGNAGERPWRQEDKARPDEGVAADARRPTRVRKDTAVNPPGRVVDFPEQRRELRRTRLHFLN